MLVLFVFPSDLQVFQVMHATGSFSVRLDAETPVNWALWRTVRDELASESVVDVVGFFRVVVNG